MHYGGELHLRYIHIYVQALLLLSNSFLPIQLSLVLCQWRRSNRPRSLLPSHCVASIIGLHPITIPVATLIQYKSLFPPSDREESLISDGMLPFSAHSPNDGVSHRETLGSGRLEGCRICGANAFRRGSGWRYWNSRPSRFEFPCSSHAMVGHVCFQEQRQSSRTLLHLTNYASAL